MSNAEKLATFIAEIQSNIRKLGEMFEDPDDDWMPTGFVESDDNTLALISMEGGWFATGPSKDMLAQVLKSAMVRLNARRYAVLFSVWGLNGPTEEQWREHRNGKNLWEFENSKEMLILVTGDAEQEFCYEAEIYRHDGAPPTLGEWNLIPEFDGRFARLNEQMRGLP